MNFLLAAIGLVLVLVGYWVFATRKRTRLLENFRRDFIANISHEFRTPLTVIAGYTETLLDSKPPPDTLPHLETIRDHTERLIEMVDRILELSRLENVAPGTRSSFIHLPDFFSSMRKRVEPRLKAKGIEWEVTLAPPLENIQSDAGLLDMIFSNLVDNAIKYTDGKSSLRIMGQRVQKKIRFAVEDTGIGIRPEDQQRVFERFYRVATDRSKDTGGSGLGLSIVKHAVSALGGEIRMTSERGKGSRFSFTIEER